MLRRLLPKKTIAASLFAVFALLAVVSATSADSTPHWAQGLFSISDRPGTYCQCIYDDGTGPALYTGAGGNSTYLADGLIRYKDGAWQTTGGKFNGIIYAMCVYDDGTGPALYVAGSFTSAGGVAANCVAKWSHGAWQTLGNGMPISGSIVYALCVYDDGTGPALYAGGAFGLAGTVSTRNIARWKGGAWQAVGSGTQGQVSAMYAYNDGSGMALYVGGWYSSTYSNYIARRKNNTWQTLGSGVDGSVSSFCAYNDGNGMALYVGGSFTTAGGVAAVGVARWKNSAWQAVGAGLNGYARDVRTLCIHDDGAGAALYAGGRFDESGLFNPMKSISKLSNGTWIAVGSGMTFSDQNSCSVNTLCSYNDGTGKALYAAGPFTTAGTAKVPGYAIWRNSAWHAPNKDMNDYVQGLYSYDDGTGSSLYAIGPFTTAGGIDSQYIASWKKGRWQSLGGLSGQAYAMAVYDDGGGPGLYVGGFYSKAGNVTVNSIGRWRNGTWSTLGSGVSAYVYALCSVYEGAGPALYAGGSFTTAGGVSASKIAKWSGGAWYALGSGLSGGSVNAICEFDDGSGPAVYAAGDFTTAGGTPANGIAKWNGITWEALGSGLSGGKVTGMCVYDDGTGPALYVGGSFTTAGGVSANRIARWKNGAWEAVGGGVTNLVYSLTVHDDGSGAALYVAGAISKAGTVNVNCIARWRNGVWESLGTGVSSRINALCTHDGALFAGGTFSTAGGHPSSYLARWGTEPDAVDVSAGSVKQLDDTSLVSLSNHVTTAVFGDSFYMEDGNRSGGIRVDLQGHTLPVNTRVSVAGRARTDCNGERYISGFSAMGNGPASVSPIAISLNNIGGGTLGAQNGVWGWVRSTDATGRTIRAWKPESGLNNIGMLVRTIGTFAANTSGTFYISDGIERVLVSVPSSVTISPGWQRLMITGISGCRVGASGLERHIRVRSLSDIVEL